MITEEQLDISFDCVLPSAIFFNENLEPNCIRFYAIVRNLTKMKGYCFARNEYLAKLLKTDVSSIKRWLSSLQREGFLEVHTSKDGIAWQRHIYLSDKFKKSLRRLKNELPPAQNCAPPSSKMSHIIEDKNIEDKKKGERDALPLFVKGAVKMPQAYYDNLVEDFGSDIINDYMENLDLYSKTNPKRFKQYECHSSVIRQWLKRDGVKKKSPQEKDLTSPAQKRPTTLEERNCLENDKLLSRYRNLQTKGLMVYLKDNKVEFPTIREIVDLKDSPSLVEKRVLDDIIPRLSRS